MLRSFLINHADKHSVSYHMPGHKGSAIYKKYGYGEFLEKFMDCDITEIPGADNLFQTEGLLKEVQEKYARLYDVERSYLQINGTSGGLIAAILACVPQGGKIIMARNCHKSVFNALTLGNIKPVYAHPAIIDEYGITGPIQVSEIERLLEEVPDADAVILPSPNYYGICSDIKAISEAVHKKGKPLIVDQAHGAHLHFFNKFGQGRDMPPSAEEAGADITVNSIHKTLASFTQSAVLDFNTDIVDRYVLEDKLQAIQSTSPSYILMAGLEINADILENHGSEAMEQWKENIEWFYKKTAEIKELKVMREINIKQNRSHAGEKNGKADMDITKINLDMSSCGIDGAKLESMLIEKNIYTELYTGNILMCMTGIGNTREDFQKLFDALRDIAKNTKCTGAKAKKTKIEIPSPGRIFPVPGNKEYVELTDAAGRICASSLIPYPPGVPFVCPGEEITEETADYIKSLRDAGEKVVGVNDKGMILVGKQG